MMVVGKLNECSRWKWAYQISCLLYWLHLENLVPCVFSLNSHSSTLALTALFLILLLFETLFLHITFWYSHCLSKLSCFPVFKPGCHGRWQTPWDWSSLCCPSRMGDAQRVFQRCFSMFYLPCEQIIQYWVMSLMLSRILSNKKHSVRSLLPISLLPVFMPLTPPRK